MVLMKYSLKALLLATTVLACIPGSAQATALSDLTAATADHSIDNGNKKQIWNWNTLSSGKGLTLHTNSTSGVSGGGETLLFVHSEGEHVNSNILTYQVAFENEHTGTNSTNYGLTSGANYGTHNIGIQGYTSGTNDGDTGIIGIATGATGATYGIRGSSYSSTGYAGYFDNNNGGYAAAFMGGKVGIGTATPQSLVHAYGGEVQVGSSGASCAAANSGAIRFSSSTLYFCNGSAWTSIGGGGGSGTVSNGSAGQVAYYQSNGTTVIGTSTLNIVSSNVGVGVASPAYSLDVNGTVHASSGLLVGTTTSANSATIGGGLSAGQNSSAAVELSGNSGWGGVKAYNTTGGASTTLVMNAYGGNVGVGVTNPTYTLQVNGSVAGTSAYVNLSDARHKKNVKPLQTGVKEVQQLKPVTFEWQDKANDDGMKGAQIGFIAQDVEEVLPSVVLTENNSEKTKGIKYSDLIPVLTKAIQEQQAEIDELKQTVSQLKRGK